MQQRDFRVAIQVGPSSFVDEEVDAVLDTVQDHAAVDTVFVAASTWSRQTGGRTVAEHVDHGVQADATDWRGGNYATVHPEFYRDSLLGPVGRTEQYGDWDVLDSVIPHARGRGIATYALIDESSAALELRRYPGFLRCLEVDIWNKPARRPCYNNPDYRNWHLGLVEDYIKSYELDGLSWRAGRLGPLHSLAGAPTPQGLGLVSCFCRHCLIKAEDRGIDWRRAQAGFRELVLWNAAAAEGQGPRDGVFVSFWRLLLRFPELLAWQSLWTDGQHQLYRDILGTVRAYKPDMEVGWDLDHDEAFSPFHRASHDCAELSHVCDFLKVPTYTTSGAAALAMSTRDASKALFGDVDDRHVYPVMLAMLGYDEPSIDDVAAEGLSGSYVRREVQRAVETSEGRCHIYAGVDVDVPATPVAAAQPGTTTTPRRVQEAVGEAYEGGARGVVLSRKYADMRLSNLAAVGEAVRQLS